MLLIISIIISETHFRKAFWERNSRTDFMNEPHFALTFNKTTIFDKDPPVISHSRNAIQELILGKHFRNVILQRILIKKKFKNAFRGSRLGTHYRNKPYNNHSSLHFEKQFGNAFGELILEM